MKKKNKKQVNYIFYCIQFVVVLCLFVFGYLYFDVQNVPIDLYETQTMLSNQKEAYYVEQWCKPDFGKREHILLDKTRVDCLAKDYAIEFDFAKKWAESIGQALYYAKMTEKVPAVALILTSPEDIKYVKRVEKVDSGIKIFLIKAY